MEGPAGTGLGVIDDLDREAVPAPVVQRGAEVVQVAERRVLFSLGADHLHERVSEPEVLLGRARPFDEDLCCDPGDRRRFGVDLPLEMGADPVGGPLPRQRLVGGRDQIVHFEQPLPQFLAKFTEEELLDHLLFADVEALCRGGGLIGHPGGDAGQRLAAGVVDHVEVRVLRMTRRHYS